MGPFDSGTIRSPRASVVLVALVVLLLLAGLGSLYLSTTTAGEPSVPRTPNELVEPKSGENAVWPYTSRSRTPAERTLAINAIVYGDSDDVRYYLTERVDATWNETNEEWEDVNPDEGGGQQTRNATIVDWGRAEGATRYTYVRNRALAEERPNGTTRRVHRANVLRSEEFAEEGRWIDESYQLHDGDYFGTRDHLRAYESPYETDEWVAIQAHSEHFDWFRLRHTVDGVQSAQKRLESDLMGRSFVADVWRMHLENDDRADADGWATVVELRSAPTAGSRYVGAAVLALVVGRSVRRGARSAGGRVSEGDDSNGSPAESNRGRSVVDWFADRIGLRRLLFGLRWLTYASLFGAVFGLYLSVRVGGILLEHHAPIGSPKVIVAALYPVIALGIPIVAYVFARSLDPGRSFVLAATGMGLAIVVDYSYLDIAVLPIDVVLHRFGVAVAIGLVAAGATCRWHYLPRVNRWFGAGVLLWLFLLLAPLVGWM